MSQLALDEYAAGFVPPVFPGRSAAATRFQFSGYTLLQDSHRPRPVRTRGE